MSRYQFINHLKQTLFLVMMVFMAFASSAQNADDVLPSDCNHWTATISYDLSIPGNWKISGQSVKMFKSGSGVSVGADYMALFGRRGFFFEPGARFFIDHYRYNGIKIGDGTAENPLRDFDPSVRMIGLRLPLTVGYKFDVFKRGSLYLSTGPEPIVGFSASVEVDEEDDKDLSDKNLYKSWMRRFDIAWDIRAAVIIDRIRIDLTGALGMLDINKDAASMHEYRLSVGLGYVF